VNAQDLALIVKETVTERAKLFSLRNDAPLLLENGLPEDVAAAMNVRKVFPSSDSCFRFRCLHRQR
jgi:hypothetical protein